MADASHPPTEMPWQDDDPQFIIPDSLSLDITTEKLEGRQRRIIASIVIPCPTEQVWRVLTDYENLANFIPNLTLSRPVERPEPGFFLEQIGSQCFLNFQFCARVVLKMVEEFPHLISFKMVEGDFKRFEGAWKLKEDSSTAGTRLTYEVVICPPRVIPVALIERHLRHDLTQNLQAILAYTIATTPQPA